MNNENSYTNIKNETYVTTEPNNSTCIKEKLRNIFHLSQFCGICLESSADMNSVNDDFEIVMYKQSHVKLLKDVIDYIFNHDVEQVMSSTYLCSNCTDKVIKSYIFIHNTRESSRIINNYIDELNSQTVNAYTQLDNTYDYENSNIVIILENNSALNDYIQKGTVKPQVITHKTEPVLTKQRKKFRGYKCVECNVILPTYRKWKKHESSYHEKPILQCKICNKNFSCHQTLTKHYKTHSIVKCKICQLIIPDGDLIEHLKLNHEDNIHQCQFCNLTYYSSEALQTHLKISHLTEDSHVNQQCLMCLKHFKVDNLTNHKCRFRCTECLDLPCIHHKYLISYREQVLNHSTKIKCIDCDYICRKKEFLLGHVNREHLDHHPFSCDHCGQYFYSKLALKSHIYQFHTEFFTCEHCDQEFRIQSSYENHKSKCQLITREHKCDECIASFDGTDELANHIKHKHEIYPCGLCKKKFTTDGKLKEHKAKVHSGVQIKNRRYTTECPICEEKFDTKGDLWHHIKTHGPHVKYPCRVCNIEFDTLRKLHLHKRKHYAPYNERVHCAVCEKELAAICLPQHMLRHASEIGAAPTYTCDICGKSFPLEISLKYHLQIHLEPVPCPKCKKLIKPAGLRKHLKYHNYKNDPILKKKLKRQYKCKSCEYVTSDSIILESHINKYHLRIKPYVCHVCSKDFCGKQQLNRHIETHSDAKNYFCELCHKRFANRLCLKMHLRLHTGEKPYTCEVCGDKFISASILGTHRIKKHSDKSVPCPLCDRMFYIVREMRQHFKKNHWPYKDRKFNHKEVEGLNVKHYHLFEDGRRRLDGDTYEFVLN